jgi:predicted CxxxxCH...CXXCH cytochrome family protein
VGGGTLPNVRGVGAHEAHRGASAWHATIACSSCHLVPDAQDSPGHIDGDNVAEVDFTNLNRRAVYTTLTATCTNLYCHGNGQDNNGTALWIVPGTLGCTSCHSVNGNNMSGAHSAHITRNIQCSTCHSTVINADRTFKDPTLHVNGVHEVKLLTGTWDPAPDRRRCQNSACHGTRDWERNRGGGDDDDGRGGRPGGGFGGGR